MRIEHQGMEWDGLWSFRISPPIQKHSVSMKHVYTRTWQRTTKTQTKRPQRRIHSNELQFWPNCRGCFSQKHSTIHFSFDFPIWFEHCIGRFHFRESPLNSLCQHSTRQVRKWWIFIPNLVRNLFTWSVLFFKRNLFELNVEENIELFQSKWDKLTF